MLNTITPKSRNKYVVKVFNWSEVHLSKMTCYKIHTLVDPRGVPESCSYFHYGLGSKIGCQNGFAFVLQFFLLISDSLGSVRTEFSVCTFREKGQQLK